MYIIGSPAPTHLPSRYRMSSSTVVLRARPVSSSHSSASRGANTTGRRMKIA